VEAKDAGETQALPTYRGRSGESCHFNLARGWHETGKTYTADHLGGPGK
jgi:hypothetical protein